MIKIMNLKLYNNDLNRLPKGKILITTINAYCYNLLRKDLKYEQAIKSSDILLPDGVGITFAYRFITGKNITKIAGYDLFIFELGVQNAKNGRCFFLGSNENVLKKIKERISREYKSIEIAYYSPPYKAEFTENDNDIMLKLINEFKPDVLFIGMTAPKQEKWAYKNVNRITANRICCIGAVFDYYALTVNRAPRIIIKLGLEWLYRLIKEPKRLWRRYIIGNITFIYNIIKEKISIKN